MTVESTSFRRKMANQFRKKSNVPDRYKKGLFSFSKGLYISQTMQKEPEALTERCQALRYLLRSIQMISIHKIHCYMSDFSTWYGAESHQHHYSPTFIVIIEGCSANTCLLGVAQYTDVTVQYDFDTIEKKTTNLLYSVYLYLFWTVVQ